MQESTHHFTASDGTPIFYRHRPAANGNTDRAIVLLHRGHEHSARMMYVHEELRMDDFACFAWDARGHGHTSGERGDSPSVGTTINDLDQFIKHIQREHGIAPENICLIAQSVGAVIAAGWLNDYAPKIRCAILAAPAFKVKLYVPFARPALRLAHQLRGNFFVQSYVKSHYLTHDRARQYSYDHDELIAPAISVRVLLGLYDLGKRVVQNAHQIATPIQMLVSGSDFVVHAAPQHEFYNNLASPIKERHVFKGFYHDTLGEKQREEAFVQIRRFINERFAETAPTVDTAELQRYLSRREADRLATPLSLCSPRGLYWATVRAAIKWGAKFSEGLKIGRDVGFDSGSTLDYVYQNQPRGTNTFGTWIDEIYLNAIGWRGIRKRKYHLKQAINLALDKLHTARKKVHILDIAAGHGRYVLDALPHDRLPESVRLRDYSAVNVAVGQKMIAERGLEHLVSFEQVDAFNPENYKKMKPKPTLGIVSGLHELFGDNDLVLQSLKGFGEAIGKGGYLIYTNQPHHPQLELIARALTSHKDGRPNWVMRRRSQLEMDGLVEKAGFHKIAQWIDDDGIFTVSLAVKGAKSPILSENKSDETE
ncbi:bifunctional alpha/beta hydrolase/class I SAM-dependent methyltransferase [Alysiella crassa]|uniref:bifunctional alpha/beta hydrolase/class I SAM-dependent methyltransferase n=1 Tax=Alysiella crassa TaxID=153491 RepID=UPI00366FA547